MPIANRVRPPRRVLAIFLCIMLVLQWRLSWLGWQVLEQERLELAASQTGRLAGAQARGS